MKIEVSNGEIVDKMTILELKLDKIKNIIDNKQAIYDLKVDKRVNKIGDGSKLENYPLNKLPKYLQKNINKYEKWID